jgi:hypothetical protein
MKIRDKNFYLFVLFLMLITALFFLFAIKKVQDNYLLDSYLESLGIEIVQAKNFIIKENNNDHILAVKGEAVIKIKTFLDISENKANDYIEEQELKFSSLYEAVLYPYPEFLEQKKGCDEKYKYKLKKYNLGDYYLFYSDNKFNLGACSEEGAVYESGLTHLYLKDKKIFLSIEVFYPKTNHFEEIEKIIKSIFYIDNVIKISSNKENNILNNSKNKVEIFTVSACPFTRDLVSALRLFLDKVDKETKNNIDIDIFYYGTEYEDGKFHSYHGDDEAILNILELCIINKYPNNLEYFYIIDCLNNRVDLTDPDKSIIDLTRNWELCTKEVNVNKNEDVKKCVDSNEGKNLYRKSIEYILKEKDAIFPPLLKFNEQKFLTLNPDAFKLKLCRGMENNIPECSDMPECFDEVNCLKKEGLRSFCVDNKCAYDEKIKMVIIKDSSINNQSYFSNYVIDWYELLYGEFDIEYLDFRDKKAKQLSQGLNIVDYPVILISENIEKISRFKERFGNTRLIFSDKKNEWYVVDHERFNITNSIIKDNINSTEGIHFMDHGIEVSSELSQYFLNNLRGNLIND